MKSISPLSFVHQKGKFGDHENIKEKDLLKITEIKDVSIFQIVFCPCQLRHFFYKIFTKQDGKSSLSVGAVGALKAAGASAARAISRLIEMQRWQTPE